MGEPTSHRRPGWTRTAAQIGLADPGETITRHQHHLGVGGPVGPCQCSDPPDRIVFREPGCDVARRRELTKRRVWHIERRWRELRDVRRYWQEVAT
jgi:hypothetical protein